MIHKLRLGEKVVELSLPVFLPEYKTIEYEGIEFYAVIERIILGNPITVHYKTTVYECISSPGDSR